MRYGLGIDLGGQSAAAAVRRGDVVEPAALDPDPAAGRGGGAGDPDPAAAGRGGGAGDQDPAAAGRHGGASDPDPAAAGRHGGAGDLDPTVVAVVAAVTRREGRPPDDVVLVAPADDGPRAGLAEAAARAGLDPVRLVGAAEAVTAHYAGTRGLRDGALVLVHHLADGLLTTTLLQVAAGGARPVAAGRTRDGATGPDLDRAVAQHVDRALGGALGRLPDGPGTPALLARVHADCALAREALATGEPVPVAVDLPQGRRHVTLTRPELDDALRPLVRANAAAARATLRSAGTAAEDLAAVLLAGPTPELPLVAETLLEELGVAVYADRRPELVPALGAARLTAPGPAGDARRRRGRRSPSGPPAARRHRRAGRAAARVLSRPVLRLAAVAAALTLVAVPTATLVIRPAERPSLGVAPPAPPPVTAPDPAAGPPAGAPGASPPPPPRTAGPAPTGPRSGPPGRPAPPRTRQVPAAGPVPSAGPVPPARPAPSRSARPPAPDPAPRPPAAAAPRPAPRPVTAPVRSWATGRCLDGAGTGDVYGAGCTPAGSQQWTQRRSPLRPPPGSPPALEQVQLVNRATGRCLEADRAGDVSALPCTTARGGQAWVGRTTYRPDGAPVTRYTNALTRRCLTLDAAGSVYTAACSGTGLQDFRRGL